MMMQGGAKTRDQQVRIRPVVAVGKRSSDAWLDAAVHVIIVSTPEQVHGTLKDFELDAEAVGKEKKATVRSKKVSTASQQKKVVLHVFDAEAPYTSMRNIARAVAALHGCICIHVDNMPDRFTVPLMHVLAKHVYMFGKYKSGFRPFSEENVIWVLDRSKLHDKDHASYMEDVSRAIACADLTRDLENEPANLLTPAKFCEIAREKLALNKGIDIRVMDEVDIRKNGLGLVMAVGQGSDVPPRFLEISMIRDTANFVTICLVGKGVMFDAGGLRIKSAQGMADMKQDKSGAAIVLSIIEHVSRHCPELQVNLVGIMPLVENVINGSATKPGDIVRAYNGTTVEITDPDAEGRLILADAISYASHQYAPDYILDFATLTNMASTVCCDLSAVYYTKNDALSQLVYSLGEAIGERVWRHPPWHEYRSSTVSPVADARNSNFECTRSGSFMASMFVANFIEKDLADRWIHFDISNNDVRGLMSGNCSFLGMQLVKALSEVGTKRSMDRLLENLRRQQSSVRSTLGLKKKDHRQRKSVQRISA